MRALPMCLLIVLVWIAPTVGFAAKTGKVAPPVQDQHMAANEEIRQIREAVIQERLERENDAQRILTAVAELDKNEWQNQLVVSLVSVFATILGGTLAFWFSRLFYRTQVEQETRNLEGAFAGEISAILGIAQQRHYIQHLQQTIQWVQQNNQPAHFGFSANEEYFSVYKANASRLGLLPDPLPEHIAAFYTHAFSILEDVRRMAVPGFRFQTAQESLAALQNLLALFQANQARGNQIIQAISARRTAR